MKSPRISATEGCLLQLLYWCVNLAAMTAHLYKMLSIAEANETVQSNLTTLDSIDVTLLAATGYVLAEDITAKEPLPPFPASIKVLTQPTICRT